MAYPLHPRSTASLAFALAIAATGCDDSKSSANSDGECDASAPVHLTSLDSQAPLRRAHPAGDVNGDGVEDLIFGRPGTWPEEVSTAVGSARVVYGPVAVLPENLDDAPGFDIVGEGPGHAAGAEVLGLGDVNGDGFDDVLVGSSEQLWIDPDCYHDCPPAPASAGPYQAYVVFGSAEGEDVALADVGAGVGGFGVVSDDEADFRSIAPAALGDANGDGLADFALGLRSFDGWNGAVVVVHGKADGQPVRVQSVLAGQGGWGITASEEYLSFPDELKVAGDVDGDGLLDLIVAEDQYPDDGVAWVVLGRTDNRVLTTDELDDGDGAFAIRPPGYRGWTHVDGVGDFDGDGLDDVVVRWKDDDAFVVLGKRDREPVELTDVRGGRGGFQVTYSPNVLVGRDFDEDGRSDLLIRDGALFVILWGGLDAAGQPNGDLASVSRPNGAQYLYDVGPDLGCDGHPDWLWTTSDGGYLIDPQPLANRAPFPMRVGSVG